VLIRRGVSEPADRLEERTTRACRARSHAEFTARIGVVAEEADETVYWLDVVAGARLTTASALPNLQREAKELLAIFSTAVGTARRNARNTRS
jgi:four helix bundle protein